MNMFIIISIFLIINFNLSRQRPNSPIPGQAQQTELDSFGEKDSTNLLAVDGSKSTFEQLKELAIKQHEVADTVVPIVVRSLAKTVPGLAQALQHSLPLFGVTSYLVGPSIARSARNLGPVVEPLVGSTDGLANRFHSVSDLSKILNKVMVILGLDNDECKEAIACQAGLQVSTDFPILASYLVQASPSLRPEDKLTKILMDIMTSPNPQCISSCPNLSTIEKYWKAAGEKDLKTILQDGFADSISKNVFSLIIDSADGAIQNGLQKLARK